ncbi:hypothetical protein [Xenorhabdus bovienii]|uniref:Uncharacterized protein n=1 Tax=Xenorhabdus bovienii str. kraussei Becker Underwood TaxID=1398204 RepID=A0A077Q127_XENBV|nr:hypothetical protein [Xenorhabdus bovienii]CDH26737.1 hypothetical protein XBKB1_910002 [Xenorhabdus bovienii str. kraussei Becker Underwood]
MTTPSERQDMIIRTMNDREYLMSPISTEKFQSLINELGEEKLAKDLSYLQSIGLVQLGAVEIGTTDDEPYSFNLNKMALTAAGVDYANMDTIGNKINTVTIKIHQNTLEQIETIILSANLPESEKKTLLQLVKEKGAESVVGKCVDTLFANAGSVTQVLSELAKSTF